MLHAAPQKSALVDENLNHGIVFVLAVSRRANRLPKDDLEAMRCLKPERVMLTEVHLVILAGEDLRVVEKRWNAPVRLDIEIDKGPQSARTPSQSTSLARKVAPGRALFQVMKQINTDPHADDVTPSRRKEKDNSAALGRDMNIRSVSSSCEVFAVDCVLCRRERILFRTMDTVTGFSPVTFARQPESFSGTSRGGVARSPLGHRACANTSRKFTLPSSSRFMSAREIGAYTHVPHMEPPVGYSGIHLRASSGCALAGREERQKFPARLSLECVSQAASASTAASQSSTGWSVARQTSVFSTVRSGVNLSGRCLG